MHDEIQSMIESGVIDNDIVPLPANDMFDSNVFGSYHNYKATRGSFNVHGERAIAYYKIVDSNIIDAIKNAKYKKGDGHPLKYGHWFFNRKNPKEIFLYGSGLSAPRKGFLGAFRDAVSEDISVIGTIPTPKGLLNNGQLQYGRSWFWDSSHTNIFLEFQIDKVQFYDYTKLMEQVIKDIPDPKPGLGTIAPSMANTL